MGKGRSWKIMRHGWARRLFCQPRVQSRVVEIQLQEGGKLPLGAFLHGTFKIPSRGV